MPRRLWPPRLAVHFLMRRKVKGRARRGGLSASSRYLPPFSRRSVLTIHQPPLYVEGRMFPGLPQPAHLRLGLTLYLLALGGASDWRVCPGAAVTAQQGTPSHQTSLTRLWSSSPLLSAAVAGARRAVLTVRLDTSRQQFSNSRTRICLGALSPT